MWATVIFILPPRFEDQSGLVERQELIDGQAFVPQTAVKGFNKNVFHRFARMNEVELHPAVVRPIFQCP